MSWWWVLGDVAIALIAFWLGSVRSQPEEEEVEGEDFDMITAKPECSLITVDEFLAFDIHELSEATNSHGMRMVGKEVEVLTRETMKWVNVTEFGKRAARIVAVKKEQ